MSGGSLDYLCWRLNDIEGVGTKDLGNIRRALDALHEIPDDKLKASKTKAYRDLRELEAHISEIPGLFEKLRDVLHDIEWTISGDYGEDHLIESLKNYEKE